MSADAVPAYSDETFRAKLARYARTAGREVVEKALWLHYAAQSPQTPVWAKTAMYGALAYFVLPADAIPDFIPGAGFTDDLGAILTAVATVAAYITPEVKARAAAQTRQWFGESAEKPAG